LQVVEAEAVDKAELQAVVVEQVDYVQLLMLLVVEEV
jgi:hypothetical protein